MIVGSTSQILPVTMRDATTGQGLTGLAFGDMTGSYTKQTDTASTSLSFTARTVGTGWNASGGWTELGNGEYLYCFPDACFSTAGTVSFRFSATGALDTFATAKVEADWVRLGVSNKYTNTESNPGGSFDSVTVTNN